MSENKHANHRLYAAELDGEQYFVAAPSEQHARLEAASTHKESLCLSGPDVGIGVEDFAEYVELSELAISIDDETPYVDGLDVANGDPYLAVVYRTEDGDNVPSERRLLPLGTGFESFRSIVWTVSQIVVAPDLFDYDPIEFVPTHVEIYSICGAASFGYEPVETAA